jgi:assimilatory nitrate reductase catalytic subunit
VDPPGEAKPDFEIFLGLADALGVREELFPRWKTAGDAFEEWKRVSAGRLCDYSGMTYEAIEEHGGIQWPFPEGAADPQESRRLYTDGIFQTDDGRARLLPVAWEPFPEQPTAAFPLVLNTGRTVEHWHTRTKTANVPILERLSPNAWLEMNPRDARGLGLKAHDRVDVVSQRGRVRNVELRVTETIAPGQVFVPFHYAEANANQVTQSAFDPISREPNYKQSAVRVEKTDGIRDQGSGTRPFRSLVPDPRSLSRGSR